MYVAFNVWYTFFTYSLIIKISNAPLISVMYDYMYFFSTGQSGPVTSGGPFKDTSGTIANKHVMENPY